MGALGIGRWEMRAVARNERQRRAWRLLPERET